VVRVAFDPDALPEHPDAQLAGFGTPLIDQLLSSAAQRGRYARAYRNGLNLMPQGLADRIARAMAWPEGMRLEIERARALFFPVAIFWFQATFVSDQKEYQVLPIGFDLHYARQVRHIDRLLEGERLANQPDLFLPDAKHAAPAEILPLARQEVVRSLASLANAQARELHERVERQAARMQRYYRDMLKELEQQQQRAEQRGTDLEKYAARREALQREQRLRVAELRQKSSLYVHLRLATLLIIRQPKLRINAQLVSDRGRAGFPELIWDPLIESLDAVPCPECQRPTFTFDVDRYRRLACPGCATGASTRGR
jgi:hypothetical protein